MTDKRMTDEEAKAAVLNLKVGEYYFFSGPFFAAELASGFIGQVMHVYDDGSADIESLLERRDQSLVHQCVADGDQTWRELEGSK